MEYLNDINQFKIGNSDIEYFVFHDCFHIASPNFIKIKTVWNVGIRFWKLWKQKHKIMKLNEIIV